MKLLGKNRDWSPDSAPTGAIDSLLKAYTSRPANRACSEFDADLANAYIERSLTPASRSRYEQHLSECTPCRKNVTALSRLVEPLSRPLISADADSRSGAKRIFGVASWPRWAVATAAVIVLAISLPLVLTRNSGRPAKEGSQAVAESAGPDNTQAVNQPLEENKVLSSKQSAASSLASAEPAKPSEKRQVDAISASGPAPTEQPASVAGDRPASGGKLEAKPESKAVEQATVTGSAQPATELAAGQAKQEKKADKDEASRARERQPSKDASAADAKGNKEQDQENEKDKARVAENATAVPPPAAPSAKAGKLKRSPARLALRDSSAPESVRPTERKIGNKKFSLKNDTWTDKQFDPDKDLPVVTIIHSSNVYSELLSKQGGLKTYLGSFNPTERAIFVYNGTVYKLIPQQ